MNVEKGKLHCTHNERGNTECKGADDFKWHISIIGKIRVCWLAIAKTDGRVGAGEIHFSYWEHIGYSKIKVTEKEH